MNRTVAQPIVLACLAAWLLGGAPRLAAEGLMNFPPPSVPFAEDNHAFRFILHGLGLRPLQKLAELNEEPKQTLLIVMGDTTILDVIQLGHGPFQLQDLQHFLEHGGALLLATDRATSDTVDQVLNLRVTGTRLHVSANQGYRGLQDCPIVTDFSSGHVIFQGLKHKKIATNRPSYLQVVEKQRSRTIAPVQVMFPDFAYRKDRDTRIRRTFAMIYESDGDRGRVLALADHSVFINSMMLQDDNDNFLFAFNSLKWLTEGERPRVLYLHEGRLVTRFEVATKETPLPVNPVEVVNKVLAGWEDENLFNRLILEAVPFRNLLAGMAVAATVVLLITLFYRLRLARQRPETSG